MQRWHTASTRCGRSGHGCHRHGAPPYRMHSRVYRTAIKLAIFLVQRQATQQAHGKPRNYLGQHSRLRAFMVVYEIRAATEGWLGLGCRKFNIFW